MVRFFILLSFAIVGAHSRSLYLPDVEVCDISLEVYQVQSEKLWQPMGCAILSSSPVMSVGFVDSRNQVIRKINMGATNTSLIAGTGNKSFADGDVGSMASFWMPYSISTPPMDPAPYAIIADYGNRCIRKIDLGTTKVTTLVCGGLITSPSDTAVLNNGDIYIADPISHTILLFSQSMGSQVMVVAGLTGNSGFQVCYDPHPCVPCNPCYESDIYTQDGDSLIVARFNQPLGIAMHSFTGVLYIADWLNDAIRFLSADNLAVGTLIRGKGFQDGIFSIALINGPKTVRMVGAQYLAVSDSDNGAIRILDLVGQNTSTLFGDGSRAHIHGNAAIAKGSAIWGISGTRPMPLR